MDEFSQSVNLMTNGPKMVEIRGRTDLMIIMSHVRETGNAASRPGGKDGGGDDSPNEGGQGRVESSVRPLRSPVALLPSNPVPRNGDERTGYNAKHNRI